MVKPFLNTVTATSVTRLGVVVLLSLFFTFPVNAVKMVEPNDQDKWFEEDFEDKARQVNEGELHFLSNPPNREAIHSIFNTITISPRSVETQWVDFRQCHKNLDRVALSQIVYQYKQIRNLKIEYFKNIGKAWVEGQSIQLQDVMDKAEFCALAQVKILIPQADKLYVIRNGPYYRKFLDGYYPFHVQLVIKYPQTLLKIHKVLPAEQAGFAVKSSTDELFIDAWFEGELVVEVYLKTTAK